MGKINRLRNVKLNEISFVGKGDNPEAHVLLLKVRPNGDGSIVKAGKDNVDEAILKTWLDANPTLVIKDDGEALTFADIQADKDLRDKVWQMCYTLEDSLSSIVHDDTVSDKTAMISQSIDQFKAAITAITKGEESMSVELKKAQEELAAAQAQVETLTKENETLKACAADDKKKMDALEAAKLKKDAGEDEDIYKGLPEGIVKTLKENSATIAKMADENLTREYVGKAAEVGLVGKADELGDILKSVAKHDTALAGKILDVFKTADARIKEGDLLKEKGTQTDSTAVTAYDKMVAKAAELRKTSPELSAQQAFTKVYDTDTELRKEYLEERK